MAEGLETFFKLVLFVIFRELSSRFGFWVALVLMLAFVAALLGIAWGLGRLLRKAGAVLSRMRKVVPRGGDVPPLFGVSYTDLETNLRVCHVIPINFIVGLLQLTKVRLKKGLGVRLGRKHA